MRIALLRLGGLRFGGARASDLSEYGLRFGTGVGAQPKLNALVRGASIERKQGAASDFLVVRPGVVQPASVRHRDIGLIHRLITVVILAVLVIILVFVVILTIIFAVV